MNGTGVAVLDLDDKWNIVGVDWLGFTTAKKHMVDNHVVWYHDDDVHQRFALTEMMIGEILKKVGDCSYVCFEDFAMSAPGRLANIGEFVGRVSYMVWLRDIPIRRYGPSIAKKHFTGRGTADKVGMYEEFVKCGLLKPDIDGYPIPKDKDGVKPTSDIIDAYALALLLRKELMIRSGFLDLSRLSKTDAEIFGKKKKSTILETPFDRRSESKLREFTCSRSTRSR